VYRKIYPVSGKVLRGIANQYHDWVARIAKKWGTETVGDCDVHSPQQEMSIPVSQKPRPHQQTFPKGPSDCLPPTYNKQLLFPPRGFRSIYE
jgi:hypothetical protein